MPQEISKLKMKNSNYPSHLNFLFFRVRFTDEISKNCMIINIKVVKKLPI